MKIILFNVKNFLRYDLDRLDEQDLYNLALGEEENVAQIYTSQEFQEAANNEEINLDNWWLYIVNV